MLKEKFRNVAFLNRLALFIVFFWFGFLKVIGISPAEELVGSLFDKTLAFILDKDKFIIAFGLFEVLIGLLWLFPKYTKLVFYLFCLHMFSTFLPMVLLVSETWQSFMTLTLTGQYIVKNLVLLASAFYIFRHWVAFNEAIGKTKHSETPKELVLN